MLGPQNLNLALPGCSLKKGEENMYGRDVIWWLAVVGGLWMVMVKNSGGGQICFGSRGFPPHWRQQGGEREREMTGKLASSPQFLAPGAPKLTSPKKPKKSKDLRAVEILWTQVSYNSPNISHYQLFQSILQILDCVKPRFLNEQPNHLSLNLK